MQRERPTAAAAPRDRLVGGAAGSMARSAVASEESCVRCNESQGVDKEPVPLTSGLTHEYSSNSPPEVRVRFRIARNRRDKRACERETALLCLYFGTNCHRSDGSEVSRRKWHRLARQQHLRSSPLLWCTATSSSPKAASESGLKPFSKIWWG